VLFRLPIVRRGGSPFFWTAPDDAHTAESRAAAADEGTPMPP